MLRIFLNTWGNYNENGADGGEWIELPMDEYELEEAMIHIAESMGDDDPEWFINDYEWTSEIKPGEIDEMENIQELNDWVKELDGLDEYEQEEIAAAMEAFGCDFEEAFDGQKSARYTFYREMRLEEVAEMLVEECYFTKDTPEIFRTYFDYEAFARDLHLEGYYETSYGVIVE